MATSSNNLSAGQAKAITALLSEKDIKSAAAKAGVGERTLHSWLDDPDFKAALKQAEAAAIEAAVTRLAGATGDAISVLTDIMKDTGAAAMVRIRAAALVLDSAVKLREFADLEARIAELEKEGH